MKRLFILVLFLIGIAQLSYSQNWRTTGSFGSDRTVTRTRGVSSATYGYQTLTSFSDTADANAINLDQLPGITILVGDVRYLRNQAATAWINLNETFSLSDGNGTNISGGNTVNVGGTLTNNITWTGWGRTIAMYIDSLKLTDSLKFYHTTTQNILRGYGARSITLIGGDNSDGVYIYGKNNGANGRFQDSTGHFLFNMVSSGASSIMHLRASNFNGKLRNMLGSTFAGYPMGIWGYGRNYGMQFYGDSATITLASPGSPTSADSVFVARYSAYGERKLMLMPQSSVGSGLYWKTAGTTTLTAHNTISGSYNVNLAVDMLKIGGQTWLQGTNPYISFYLGGAGPGDYYTQRSGTSMKYGSAGLHQFYIASKNMMNIGLNNGIQIYDTSGTVRNIFGPNGYFQVGEASAPSSVVAGFGAIYAKTDNKLYFKNDVGTEYDLTVSGGSMVYPGAGIALSNGSGWETSITDNSANWNTAYGWGDHAGLYWLRTGTTQLSGNVSIRGNNTYSLTFDSLSAFRAKRIGTFSSEVTTDDWFQDAETGSQFHHNHFFDGNARERLSSLNLGPTEVTIEHNNNSDSASTLTVNIDKIEVNAPVFNIKDASLEAASVNHIWTLKNQTTGEGEWKVAPVTSPVTIGTINSETKSANGAVMNGSYQVVMQDVDDNFPGLMTTVLKKRVDSLWNGQVEDSLAVNRIIGTAYVDTISLRFYRFPELTNYDSLNLGIVIKPDSLAAHNDRLVALENATGSASIEVGVTDVDSGTDTRILYNNAGTLGEKTTTGTGSVVQAASPALTGTPTAPTASAGTNTTQLATTEFVKTAVDDNNSIIKSTTTISSDATPDPVGSSWFNYFTVTAQAATATFSAPSGTPANGNILLIRITATGGEQTLNWNSIYRGGTDIALPTSTNLTSYIQFVYNSTDATWDLVGLTEGINTP